MDPGMPEWDFLPRSGVAFLPEREPPERKHPSRGRKRN